MTLPQISRESLSINIVLHNMSALSLYRYRSVLFFSFLHRVQSQTTCKPKDTFLRVWNLKMFCHCLKFLTNITSANFYHNSNQVSSFQESIEISAQVILSFWHFKVWKRTYITCWTGRGKKPLNSVEIFRTFVYEPRISGSYYFHLGQPKNKIRIGPLSCPQRIEVF